jgi:hypothetical protein
MTDTTEALREKLFQAIGAYGLQCARTGELAPSPEIVAAIEAAFSQPEERQPVPATPQAAQAEPEAWQTPLIFSRRNAIAKELDIAHDREFVDIVRAVERAHGIGAAPAQGGQPGDGNG